MKKQLTLIALCLTAGLSMAQVGAVAPNFTQTDLKGVSHDLYTHLSAGKVVVVDMSATWCGPCWGFHEDHYLKDLYTEFGPAGTNQVVILFYEDDIKTTLADLNGTGSNTQGDWVTGTPYPIINATVSLPIQYGQGYPTVSVICPKDKVIKDDLYSHNTLNEMRASLQKIIADCSTGNSVAEPQTWNTIDVAVLPNPVTENTIARFSMKTNETVTVTLYSSLGQAVLTSTQRVAAGQNEVALNLKGLNAGNYFLKISGKDAASKPTLILKTTQK